MGGWGGVNNVPLDIHLHDDLFLLIASTIPRRTDALRLIDDVGLGWGGGGGVNNVPLVEFLSLAQGSAKRKRSSFGRRYFHSKTLSFPPTLCDNACIHSLIHSFIQFNSVQFSSVQFSSLHFISFICSFIHFSHIPSVPHSSTHSLTHSFIH